MNITLIKGLVALIAAIDPLRIVDTPSCWRGRDDADMRLRMPDEPLPSVRSADLLLPLIHPTSYRDNFYPGELINRYSSTNFKYDQRAVKRGRQTCRKDKDC